MKAKILADFEICISVPVVTSVLVRKNLPKSGNDEK